MLRFTCEHCGRELQSHPDNAQRSMNCPGCMKPVTIPADAGTRQTVTAPPPAGGRSMLVVIVGALLLLLVGGGAAGVWWFTKHKKEDAGPGKVSGPEDDGPEVSDLALLPADAQMVATVRSAELYKLPAAKGALEQIRKGEQKQLDPVARMERDVGLKPDEIDRLHVVGTDADKRTGWAVAKTLQPLDRDKVVAKLAGRSEKRIEGRRYFLGKNADDQEVAVHFAGPSVLVVSDEEGMKQAMKQAAKPAVDGPLKATIALVETSKSQVIVGLYPAGGGLETLKKNDTLNALLDVGTIKTVRLTIDADEKNATFKGVLEMPSEKAADALQKKLTNTLPIVGFGLRLGAQQEDKAAAEAAAKLVSAIKTSAKGNELSLTAKTDTATMATGLTYVAQQAMKKKEE